MRRNVGLISNSSRGRWALLWVDLQLSNYHQCDSSRRTSEPTNSFRNCSSDVRGNMCSFHVKNGKDCKRKHLTEKPIHKDCLSHWPSASTVCVYVWEVDMVRQIDWPQEQLLQALMHHNNTHTHTHPQESERDRIILHAGRWSSVGEIQQEAQTLQGKSPFLWIEMHKIDTNTCDSAFAKNRTGIWKEDEGAMQRGKRLDQKMWAIKKKKTAWERTTEWWRI